MKTGLSVALKAHMASGSATLATCWKVTLRNGTIVAATSHTSDLIFDGVTYQSVAAYMQSDVETTSQLAVDNLELEGFLTSPAITEEDVQSGAWDYADIEWFEVNYNDLTMGRHLMRKGTLGEVRAGGATFRAELRGLTQRLTRKIVRLITKECQYDLGDANCTVSLAPFTATGTVDGVTDNKNFLDTARTEADDYFTGGLITWNTGNNAGLSMEVKRSGASGNILLLLMMPFDIVAGDTYTMVAGCTKRFSEDCKTKFNNAVNFGGFPHLPGSDAYKGPQS